jgi:LPXTG-motif cell wall-anchored protein
MVKIFQQRRQALAICMTLLVALTLVARQPEKLGAAIFNASGKTSIFDRARGATVFSSGISPGSVGYQVLYDDVFVNSSSSMDIDALVTVTAKDGDFDITVFDDSTVQAANFFEISRNGGSAAGRVTVRFDFFEGGTYTGTGTGIPATLENVKVTSIDLDAGGVQYTDFFGYQTYRFTTDTRLQAYTSSSPSYPVITDANIPSGFTRFHQNTYPSDAAGGSNLGKDAVEVSFASFSTFSATVGNLKGGGSYYGISFDAVGICAVTTSCVAAGSISNPANRPPTSTNSSRAVASGTPTVLARSNFGTFADPDSNPFVNITVKTLPGSGTLEYNNGTAWVAVTANQVITTSDIDAGKLRYTSTSVSSFDFAVNDGLINSVADYTLSFSVSTNTQTITFVNPGSRGLADGSFSSAATASSGLGTTLVSSTTGVCTVNNSVQPPTITPVSAGTCLVTASQSGDSTYAAAADVPQTFLITAGSSPSTTAPTTTAPPTTNAVVTQPTTTTIAPSGSISGQLWFDVNDDFLVGASEPVLPGVVVNVTDAAGAVRKVSTDAQGKYSVTGLSSGSISVAPVLESSSGVVALRDSDGGTDWKVVVALSASESKSANFSARGALSISGVVRDVSTSASISKAAISCVWSGSSTIAPTVDAFKAVSAKDGSFSISGLPSGSYKCEATDPETKSRSAVKEATLSAQSVNGVPSQANLDLAIRKMSILPETGFESTNLVLLSFMLLALGMWMISRSRRQHEAD